MRKYMQLEHPHASVENVKFSWKVIRSFKTPLERQITEAVYIANKEAHENLNSKSEFNGPPKRRLGLGNKSNYFQCNICSAKFQNEQELKKHHEMHHNKIACDQCDYNAIGTYDFKQHNQIMHKVDQ